LEKSVLIKGLILTAIENSNRIRFGNGLSNKSRLLGIVVLQFIPRTIKRVCDLDKNIEKMIEELWKGTVVNIYGFKYTLIDYESFVIINESEDFMFMWLKPEKGEVLADIGAHIGKYTLTTAKIVGDEGVVVAIEPDPENYQALQNNIKINNIKNVIALNLAAWDKDCILKLFTGHLAGHNSLKINWKLGGHEVRAKTMDSVLRECGVDRVDWIKIDVEGAEWEVLCGLRETIDEKRPRIVAEVSYENIDRIKEFMEERGYGLIKIAPLFEGIIYGVFRKFAYFFFLPYA
jgi:FkbM family methyltransferase